MVMRPVARRLLVRLTRCMPRPRQRLFFLGRSPRAVILLRSLWTCTGPMVTHPFVVGRWSAPLIGTDIAGHGRWHRNGPFSVILFDRSGNRYRSGNRCGCRRPAHCAAPCASREWPPSPIAADVVLQREGLQSASLDQLTGTSLTAQTCHSLGSKCRDAAFYFAAVRPTCTT